MFELVDQAPGQRDAGIDALAGQREPGSPVPADPRRQAHRATGAGDEAEATSGSPIVVLASATTVPAKAGSSMPEPKQAPWRWTVDAVARRRHRPADAAGEPHQVGGGRVGT